MTERYRNYEWLKEQYETTSIGDIAGKENTSIRTIEDWLNKFELTDPEERPSQDGNIKKVLIIGANGFVGENLWHYLAQNRKHYDILRPNRLGLDVMDFKSILAYLYINKPNIVINLAAFVGGIGLNKDRPATMIYKNLQMGLNVTEACSQVGIKKLVYLGSVCCYPKIPANIPFVEEDIWDGRPEPTNEPYGLAKKTIGFMLDCYARQYKSNYAYLIPTNMYGPFDDFSLHSSHVIPAMINKFVTAKATGDKVTLWGDGTPSRDFLYVEDCCKAIVSAMENPTTTEPINLGSGQETTMKELADTIAELLEFDGEVEWDATKPNGQPRRVLNVDKAKTNLEIEPDNSLKEGLIETITWYKSVFNNR